MADGSYGYAAWATQTTADLESAAQAAALSQTVRECQTATLFPESRSTSAAPA